MFHFFAVGISISWIAIISQDTELIKIKLFQCEHFNLSSFYSHCFFDKALAAALLKVIAKL